MNNEFVKVHQSTSSILSFRIWCTVLYFRYLFLVAQLFLRLIINIFFNEFKEANYERGNENLGIIDWIDSFSTLSSEKSADFLQKTPLPFIKQRVLLRTFCKSKFLPWILRMLSYLFSVYVELRVIFKTLLN